MILNGNKFRIIYKMFLKFNNELYICSCKNLYIWIYYGKDDEFFSYNNFYLMYEGILIWFLFILIFLIVINENNM